MDKHTGDYHKTVMVHQLHLQLLGDCQITFDQTTFDQRAVVELPLAKARALLAYLAVSGRAEPRTVLVDLLWSELGEAAARRNLRVVLTQMRQILGEYVTATRTTVAFRRDLPYWLDVETFVAGAQSIRSSGAEALSPAQAEKLAQGFDLYRGDFLRGLEVHNAPIFEEWMLIERERLRQLALGAGQRLTAHYMATGDDAAALTICQRLLAIEPYREETHRQCMLLLARNGQRTAALQQYEQCRQMLADELAVEPDAETGALYAKIRAGAFTQVGTRQSTAELAPASAPAPLPPQHLPMPTTPFVGRDAELEQLTALLSDPVCRLLTLVGPGGIGKTRLALQAASAIIGAPTGSITALLRDGVFFVATAAVTTIADLIPTIAAALGLSFSGQAPAETQLLNYLRPRRLLLLLDNFEQLVAASATLTTWLQEAPGLRLLVTSRERLNLYDEWLFAVEGLPIPTHTSGRTGDDLAHYAAVQLFVQRARRVNLGFTLTREAATVAAICTLLQGMPLAIELAAGWVRTHSCAEILREVQRNLDFLATTLRDQPERHHSLRAAFAHSWQLLTPADATVYRRLALLRGGFTAATAAAIADAGQPTLTRLVDKSLVQRSPDARYMIHELLRQYAVQHLNTAEEQATLAAYCRYIAQRLTAWDAWRETAREPEALAALELELENLRVAWGWLTHQLRQVTADAPVPDAAPAPSVVDLLQLAAQLSSGVTYFFLRRSRYQEGKQWLTLMRTALPDRYGTLAKGDEHQRSAAQVACFSIQLDYAEVLFNQSQFTEIETLLLPICSALRLLSAPLQLATALTILGKTYVRMGHYPEAEQALQESLTHYRQIGAHKTSTVALNALGILYSNQGHFAQAEEHYRACLAIFAEHGYQRGLANISNNLGSNFARSGNHSQALPLYEQTYALAQAVGEELMIAVALSNLGSASRALGNYAAAQRYYEESLAHCRAMGERRWTAAGLNGLGLTLLDQGKIGQAHVQFTEALTIAQEIQSKPDMLDALAGLGEAAIHCGAPRQAASILHFVAHHPVTQTLAQQRCQHLLTQLRQQLTPEELTIISQDAATADWKVVLNWVNMPSVCKPTTRTLSLAAKVQPR